MKRCTASIRINASGGGVSLAWFVVAMGLLVFASGCTSPDEKMTRQAPPSPRAEAVTTETTSTTYTPSAVPSTINADSFVDPTHFLEQVMRADARDRMLTNCSTVRAGVVNHHILAADILADFFSDLGRCRPDLNTVIILSPDHYHAGHAPLMTHAETYRTQGSDVLVATSSEARLLAMVPVTHEDPIPFEREHGVGALVPFLHHELPDARIVPIAIEGKIDQPVATAVATWLKTELRDPHTFVIVSSDMSHYLHQDQADQNDQATLNAFADLDATFFFRHADDFTDNGKSIWITLQALQPSSWHVLLHKSSTDYGGSPLNTTTYITGFWK